MRDYGKVSAQFWIGKSGKAMRGKPEAQLVALYLMTCPTSDMTGVFHCPLMYIAHETGLGLEGASKGLQSLIDMGFCLFDEDSDMVFVVEMAKFQIGEELKVSDNQVKGVKKAYSAMKSPLKEAFYARYREAFHLDDASPSKAPSKPRTGARAGTEAGTDSAPNGAGVPPDQNSRTDEAEKTKRELWRAGKSLLSDQGMPQDQCGTFVGKLCKDYGDDIVIEAVRAAVVQQPADAASFLKAACMARKQEGGKSLIPWHATSEGVAEKGLSLDPPIVPLPGESEFDFKAKVVAAVENGGKVPQVSGARITTFTDEKQERGAPPPGWKGPLGKQQTGGANP